MFKKNQLIVIGSLVILAVGASIPFLVRSDRLSGREIRFSLIYNPANDREVVGAFNNVFTGKVIKSLGSTPYDAIPQQQFQVEVAYNVKGKLSGVITVSQLGGYKDGALYLLNKNGELTTAIGDRSTDELDATLKVGSTYLFATRLNSKMNWHLVSSDPSGITLLSDDSTLDKDRIIELSKKDQRVNELKEAYKMEIVPLTDERRGNVPNRYQNTVEE
jgi:hypothetical protein